MNTHDLEQQRHSLAHLLAAAVLELYPEALRTIGPAIDDGFYYDFDNLSIGENELKKIEKRMKRILPTWKTFEGREVSADEARETFKDNPYKLELIDEIVAAGEKITLYTSGDFTDLCRGGHSNDLSTIDPDSFTLDRVAGAYWRGDEKNKMLTRIYGLAFESTSALEQFKKVREEAKERDHRKIGKELDLFTFSDLVGSGLPLWTPHGTAVRNALLGRLLKISQRHGMLPVTIPHLAKRALYETSGHAEKFADELLTVQSKYDEFVLKPVNCPHHTQIFAGQPRSYKDLPLRYMESTMQYRDEKPGEIGGLTRVRAITVDDGHIFCTPDQVHEEAVRIAKIIEEFHSAVGLYGSHWVSLSVRDSENLGGYIGNEEDWQKAETMLQSVSDEMQLNAKRMEGEAAIYGPKLDYMFKDALGRVWQLATIQIDFAMPKRFGLEYTDSDGARKTPVMIHRAILGSYERFLAILLEHYAGNLPFWMSPVQIKIIPIGDEHTAFAKEIYESLLANNFRAELNLSNSGFGKKVRDAKNRKVPYFFVIGNKELEDGKITVESRDNGNLGSISLKEVISKLSEEDK